MLIFTNSFKKKSFSINLIYTAAFFIFVLSFIVHAQVNSTKGKGDSLLPAKIEIDSASLFFLSPKTIHAITFDNKGLMYVGGKSDVFKISPDKSFNHFITLKDTSSETIIWSMVFGKDGNLYIAAKDRIVKVTSDGTQTVIIKENFTGPCGATDLRFDKQGNLYVVYDNIIAKYDPLYNKSILVDGSKFQTPIKWAVGMEFSQDEKQIFIGDCGGSKVYIIPIDKNDFYSESITYPTNFGQYFTKDALGNIYLSSIGGFDNIAEFNLLRDNASLSGIFCKIKPPQNEEGLYKKAIAFGSTGFDKNAIYCIIGSKIYSYHLDFIKH